jgi:hypothetical protein
MNWCTHISPWTSLHFTSLHLRTLQILTTLHFTSLHFWWLPPHLHFAQRSGCNREQTPWGTSAWDRGYVRCFVIDAAEKAYSHTNETILLGTSATYALNTSASLVFSMVSEKIIVCFCLFEIIYAILSMYITLRLPRIRTKQMHSVSYLAYPMHLL